jgi:hypothetical protein
MNWREMVLFVLVMIPVGAILCYILLDFFGSYDD